jgi:hypothetical protein
MSEELELVVWPDGVCVRFSILWRKSVPEPETGANIQRSLRLRWPDAFAGAQMQSWLANELEHMAKQLRADPHYLSPSEHGQEEE